MGRGWPRLINSTILPQSGKLSDATEEMIMTMVVRISKCKLANNNSDLTLIVGDIPNISADVCMKVKRADPPSIYRFNFSLVYDRRFG